MICSEGSVRAGRCRDDHSKREEGCRTAAAPVSDAAPVGKLRQSSYC